MPYFQKFHISLLVLLAAQCAHYPGRFEHCSGSQVPAHPSHTLEATSHIVTHFPNRQHTPYFSRLGWPHLHWLPSLAAIQPVFLYCELVPSLMLQKVSNNRNLLLWHSHDDHSPVLVSVLFPAASSTLFLLGQTAHHSRPPCIFRRMLRDCSLHIASVFTF